MKTIHLLVTGLAFLATAASAHTVLSGSVPAEQAVVATAPKEIVLTFSTDVRITALSLEDAAAVAYELGALPRSEQREFAISVPALPPGAYTVIWRAVGADTHVVSGEVHFSIESS